MEKRILEKDLWLYTFEPLSNKHFPFNIVALICGDEVLLIDTGFEDHARAYLADLKKYGKSVSKVVLSHYHPDHVHGLRELGEVETYGSNLHRGSYLSKLDDYNMLRPTVEVREKQIIEFGRFSLEVFSVPGHDAATLWTLIDDQWLYVADDFISSENGDPVLPAVSHKHARRQYEALETMKSLSDKILIPAHGMILHNHDQIIYEIEDRQIYLKNIIQSPALLPYEEAVNGCQNTYLHSEWHDTMHTWE